MQKTAVSIIIITLLSLLLLGCRQEEGVETVTVVAQQPTSFPASTNFSHADYKLTTPDVQTLIQLRMDPYKMPLVFAGGLNLKPITLPEHDATDLIQMRQQRLIFDDYFMLIENDLQQHYPKNIKGSSIYLFEAHDYGYSSPHLFGRGIIDFLNTYGHSLDVSKEQTFKIVLIPNWYKGKIAIKSYPMQLDDDPDIELLLHVYHIETTVNSKYSSSVYIPVNISEQNHLEIIPNNFKYLSVWCDQVDITHDLNHDKQNDLVISCEGPVAYAMIKQLIVFGWGKSGVYRIGETEGMSWRGDEQPPYDVDIDDVDSDGFEEIIWQIPCNGHTKGNCEIVNTFSWPGQQDLHQEESSPFVDSEACKEMMAAFAQNYKTEQCLRQLREIVITQTDPDIPNKITDLLNYLPSDDPEARPYREHLTYLLGYHYELSGVEEEAVATYLDLIQQNPSSPWSWLAWARLEPVGNQ